MHHPGQDQGHFCAFIDACTHSTMVFLTLGLTASSRAPPVPPQPKLHQSRTVSYLLEPVRAKYLAQSRCSFTQELVTRTFSVPGTIC